MQQVCPCFRKLCVQGEKLMSYDNSWLLPLLLHGFWEIPVSSVTLSGNAVDFPSFRSTICYLWTCIFTNMYIVFIGYFFGFIPKVERGSKRLSHINTTTYSLKFFTMLLTRHCSVLSTSNDQLHLSRLQMQRVVNSCWSKYQLVC